jgi:hypothetical protein
MISIHVDTRGVTAMLTRAQDQLPFAISLGLNRLANAGQAAEQAQMRHVFKLRREQFVVRGVKINKVDRATKTSWRVVIQLAYPDSRPFMDQHEKGGFRTRHGGRFLWQPNQQVFRSKVIAASNPLHPRNLHMHKTDKGQIKGDQRTFMVKTASGQRLVLQREDRRLDKRSARGLKSLTLDNLAGGQGPNTKKQKRSIKRTGGTRLLYRLVERVRIPADLRFVSTIEREVAMKQRAIMQDAMHQALRTAR